MDLFSLCHVVGQAWPHTSVLSPCSYPLYLIPFLIFTPTPFHTPRPLALSNTGVVAEMYPIQNRTPLQESYVKSKLYFNRYTAFELVSKPSSASVNIS